MNKRQTILNEEQFFNRKIVDDNGCWLWQGSLNRSGYGIVNYWGVKNKVVSRVSLTISTGKEPYGMQACHTCDVAQCYNPKHLYWGTPEENQKDRIGKPYFGGKCRRGHDKEKYGMGKNKTCKVCRCVTQLARKLERGEEITPLNIRRLATFGIDALDPDFANFLKREAY